jgi:hypothetical protein
MNQTFHTTDLEIVLDYIIIFSIYTQSSFLGTTNPLAWFTRLIYMASLIAPLRRAHRVHQLLYLICPNQTPNEKLMGFESF